MTKLTFNFNVINPYSSCTATLEDRRFTIHHVFSIKDIYVTWWGATGEIKHWGKALRLGLKCKQWYLLLFLEELSKCPKEWDQKIHLLWICCSCSLVVPSSSWEMSYFVIARKAKIQLFTLTMAVCQEVQCQVYVSIQSIQTYFSISPVYAFWIPSDVCHVYSEESKIFPWLACFCFSLAKGFCVSWMDWLGFRMWSGALAW